MKDDLSKKIMNILTMCRRYLKLQIDYAKFTAAEKVTLLLGGLALGFICLILGAFFVLFMSFALVDVFKSFLSPGLAYICVSGVFIILGAVAVIGRNALIINPLSRFISKLFLERKDNK